MKTEILITALALTLAAPALADDDSAFGSDTEEAVEEEAQPAIDGDAAIDVVEDTTDDDGELEEVIIDPDEDAAFDGDDTEETVEE